MNRSYWEAPQKNLAAICGLFCASCSIFIDTIENPDNIKKAAKRHNISFEDMACEGCRSENINIFCREKCNIAKCAKKKGMEFCGQCEEYPCRDLKEFQAGLPNRLELWESLDRINEAGYETWYMEMLEHYSCPECSVINSVNNISCRKCGATPGSSFVKIHKEKIEEMKAGRKTEETQ